MSKMISQTKRFFSCCVSGHNTMNHQTHSNDVDVREEYANAFRTESYNEFWTRVTALTHTNSATRKLVGSTSASRLLSYRLFVENLLDPDQPTVTKLLSLDQYKIQNKALISDYFQTTANASIMCGLLLKDIDQMRIKFKSLKKTLESFELAVNSSANNSSTTHLPTILAGLTKFTKSINPFVSSSSTLTRFRVVKSSCSELLKRLESSRGKFQAKLHLINSLKHGSAVFLVALTTSITLVIVTHFLAVSVAIPGFMIASLGRDYSTKRMAKMSALLDMAAKGTYILNRDLDTISRLVARLDDELEHIRTMIGFWMVRAEDQLQAQATEEVVRQLKKNDLSFIDQLDELEEHLYLCFMTINRARSLVVKEILALHPI